VATVGDASSTAGVVNASRRTLPPAARGARALRTPETRASDRYALGTAPPLHHRVNTGPRRPPLPVTSSPDRTPRTPHLTASRQSSRAGQFPLPDLLQPLTHWPLPLAQLHLSHALHSSLQPLLQPLAAAPPAPPIATPGLTPLDIYVCRGRGSGAKRRTPFLAKAQADSQRNTRRRGGGLLRSWKKPIERNRWRETQGAKQASRGRSAPHTPAPAVPLADNFTRESRRSSSGGGPVARPAQLRGRLP
jgi:hypothetical protein